MIYQIQWEDGKDYLLIPQTKVLKSLLDKQWKAILGRFSFPPESNN